MDELAKYIERSLKERGFCVVFGGGVGALLAE
jgi:hypothetical protein